MEIYNIGNQNNIIGHHKADGGGGGGGGDDDAVDGVKERSTLVSKEPHSTSQRLLLIITYGA